MANSTLKQAINQLVLPSLMHKDLDEDLRQQVLSLDREFLLRDQSPPLKPNSAHIALVAQILEKVGISARYYPEEFLFRLNEDDQSYLSELEKLVNANSKVPVEITIDPFATRGKSLAKHIGDFERMTGEVRLPLSLATLDPGLGRKHPSILHELFHHNVFSQPKADVLHNFNVYSADTALEPDVAQIQEVFAINYQRIQRNAYQNAAKILLTEPEKRTMQILDFIHRVKTAGYFIFEVNKTSNILNQILSTELKNPERTSSSVGVAATHEYFFYTLKQSGLKNTFAVQTDVTHTEVDFYKSITRFFPNAYKSLNSLKSCVIRYRADIANIQSEQEQIKSDLSLENQPDILELKEIFESTCEDIEILDEAFDSTLRDLESAMQLLVSMGSNYFAEHHALFENLPPWAQKLFKEKEILSSST